MEVCMMSFYTNPNTKDSVEKANKIHTALLHSEMVLRKSAVRRLKHWITELTISYLYLYFDMVLRKIVMPRQWIRKVDELLIIAYGHIKTLKSSLSCTLSCTSKRCLKLDSGSKRSYNSFCYNTTRNRYKEISANTINCLLSSRETPEM